MGHQTDPAPKEKSVRLLKLSSPPRNEEAPEWTQKTSSPHLKATCIPLIELITLHVQTANHLFTALALD